VADDGDIKKDVNRGLAWVGLASSSVGLLDAVGLFIVLGIWISPGEYGIAALAITLFPVLDRATDLGLSAAVIQRDDHTEGKISTVFWLNVVMSILIFLALWLGIGPGLASFHGHQIVADLLTVYGFKLLWQNVYFMPWALMTKDLRFKELSVVRIFANIAEFAGKIGFAAAGFGIWCFVAGPLCRVFVSGVGIQICRPWRPRFVFRPREAWAWFMFGLKASGSKVLFYLYTNVDYQIVGYYFGDVANGLYRLAYELVLEPCRVISDVIIAIAFPTFSKLKHHKDRVIEQFIAFTRMNLVVMIGFLGAIFLACEDIILLWNPEYIDAVAATRILCFVGVLRALSFVVPPLLDGLGRPSLTLIYTSVAAVVIPTFFILGAELFGDELQELSVALAWAVGYPIAFVVLFWMALVLLELPIGAYLKRSAGIPALALVAMGAAAGVRYFIEPLHPVVRLVGTAGTMVAVFFVLLALFEGISPRSVMRAIKGD
jgi:O-antigen/teichoic acid export membrane protein